MEPHLKSQKGQPFVLELSSLEKVVCELGDDIAVRNAFDKVKLLKDGDRKDESAYHLKDIYSDDNRSDFSDQILKVQTTSSTDRSQTDDSEFVLHRNENRNDTINHNKSGIYNHPLIPEGSLNENEASQDKTGLDKLIPYHLFNCINPDIIIRIVDVEFGVHRPLLKLYTSFFEEAVAEMDECLVTLPHNKIKMEVFQSIYSWMLHDSEEALNFIDRKNIANIYVAAKYLKIEELITACKIILDSNELFMEMTAFSLFMEAYSLEDTEMQMMMLPRIQSVFLHIVSSSLFVNLSVEIILMLLSSDHIKIHSELEVFYSAIKWLLHDWPTRGFNAIRVMNVVRFALLKPSQLIDLKRCPDSPIIKMISNSKDILKLIDDGIALSVKLETHGGSPDLLKEECDKLGLKLPATRCWFEENLPHQTYDEFLEALEVIKKQHHYT